MCLWCFCLLLLPLLRPDSPPLLDKVGLTGEPGAPWVLRLEVQVCLPLFSAHVKDRCRPNRPTSADFSAGHTPRAFPTPSAPSSLVAFNILIYCWQVIESHCFWGCEEKEGIVEIDDTCHRGKERGTLARAWMGSYFCTRSSSVCRTLAH